MKTNVNVVVTGNIGCGKSTVTKILEKHLHNWTVYDVDAQVHKLYSGNTYQQTEFQHQIFDEFGTRERADVAKIVFDDRKKLKRLEKIVETYLLPGIRQRFLNGATIFDFPTFFESGGDEVIPANTIVIGVTCTKATQLARVLARGTSESHFTKVMENQMSSEAKMALCDIEINTECSLDEVEEQVARAVRPILIQTLKPRFIAAHSNMYHDVVDKLWADIVKAYEGVPNRMREYHTLNHLAMMFDQWDRLPTPNAYRQRRVGDAIIMHDAIYHVDSNTNEEDSIALMAELNRKYGGVVWTRDRMAELAEMIMATKSHDITSPYILSNPELKSDTELLLDLDMSMFTLTPQQVNALDFQINLEYTCVYPTRKFQVGRVKFLQGLLEREHIYHTDAYRAKEPEARANIQMLIDKYHVAIAAYDARVAERANES